MAWINSIICKVKLSSRKLHESNDRLKDLSNVRKVYKNVVLIIIIPVFVSINHNILC